MYRMGIDTTVLGSYTISISVDQRSILEWHTVNRIKVRKLNLQKLRGLLYRIFESSVLLYVQYRSATRNIPWERESNTKKLQNI